MTQEEIKNALRDETVIEDIIRIANGRGDIHTKICGIRDYLLHAITGYWWDEIE
jgi:hypothetical protein